MSVVFQTRPISIDYTFLLQPLKPPDLSWEEKEALRELLSLPFDYVLDVDQYLAFTLLGQQFFNKFKKESHGSTQSAKESLEKIHASIPFNCYQFGKELKEHVRKAWEGVGDEKWQWG